MAYPTFRRWVLIGCCASKFGIECDYRSPWLSIEGWAVDAEGRNYSFDISIRSRFDEQLDDEDRATLRLVRLPVESTDPVWVTEGWEFPSVVVDGPSFDGALVDRLVFGDAHVRLAVFTPNLTEGESEELAARDEVVEHEMVARAAAVLAERYGAGWRIEAHDAHCASEVLIEAGFLAVGPERFFSAFRENFSGKARRLIRAQFEASLPGHF